MRPAQFLTLLPSLPRPHRTSAVIWATALSLVLSATGCASSSTQVATAYVSPLQYQHFDCNQLASELTRVSQRAQQLGGRLDEAASNDKALTAVTLLLFWPAAFALGGTKGQEAEYARLKGEADAIQQAAVAKRCPGMMPAAPSGAPAAANPVAR